MRGMQEGMGLSLATALLAALLAGCVASEVATTAPQTTAARSAPRQLEQRFLEAIRDASVPEPSEVHDVIAITDDNPSLIWRDPATKRQLLAVVFMTEESYRRYYSQPHGVTPPGRPVVWVTLAPQLYEFCHSHRDAVPDLELRLEQYLGLPPAGNYSRVAEIWVDRQDLFRPCPDPRTDTNRCPVSMSGNPQVRGVPDYQAFFAGLYVNSYAMSGAPWTRLGYTYDWSGPVRSVGGSEFMLVPNAGYDIIAVPTIDAYCGRPSATARATSPGTAALPSSAAGSGS